jgi:hypothetical protein
MVNNSYSDSARHRSQDICPPISQIVLKNFTKICLLIKECPEEILIKLAFVLKLFKSDSMRLAITTHLSFYYKTDETFIICHEDFIIKLSPLSDDPIFTCKNDLP